MDGLLEFMFEGVPKTQLTQMIIDFICDQNNVIDAVQDGMDVEPTSVLKAAYWENITSAGQDAACTVNMRAFIVAGKSVERATLRIILYDDTIDVSVLLASTDCRKAHICSSAETYEWARAICTQYGVENFCGGLDTASDEDTQLFSKDGIGSIASI